MPNGSTAERGDIENRIKELHDLEIEPHQLHQLLGQPVSCPTHRRCLRPDAGVALAGCRYGLCPRSSLHVARTTVEARRSGLGRRYDASSSICPLPSRFYQLSVESLWRSARQPAKSLFAVYELNDNPHRQRSGQPCLSILQFDIPIPEFCDSLARPTPTNGIYILPCTTDCRS